MLALKDHPVPLARQARKVCEASRGFVVKWGHKDRSGLKARRAIKARPGRKAPRVTPARLDRRGRRASKAFAATPAQQAHKGRKACKGTWGHKALQALVVLKDRRPTRWLWPPDSLEHSTSGLHRWWDRKALKARRGLKGCKGFKALQDHRDRKARLVHKACGDRKAQLVRAVIQAPLAHKAQRALTVRAPMRQR